MTKPCRCNHKVAGDVGRRVPTGAPPGTGPPAGTAISERSGHAEQSGPDHPVADGGAQPGVDVVEEAYPGASGCPRLVGDSVGVWGDDDRHQNVSGSAESGKP